MRTANRFRKVPEPGERAGQPVSASTRPAVLDRRDARQMHYRARVVLPLYLICEPATSPAHRPTVPPVDTGAGRSDPVTGSAATQSRHQPGTPPRRDRPRPTGSAASTRHARNRRARRSVQTSSLAGDRVTRGCPAVFERDADLMTAATPRLARSGWRRPPAGLPASARNACFRRHGRRRRGLHSLRGRWVRAPAALPSRFRAVAGYPASRSGAHRRHGPPNGLPSSS